jgi:hypothetical protein
MEVEMKSISRLTLCIPLAFAAVLFLAASHLQLVPGQSPSLNFVLAAQAQGPPDQGQAPPPPDQGPDPAAANMAPDTTGQGPNGQSYTTEAPPPAGQGPDDSNYAEQPTEEATQPPPPLPDYAQPPAPDDGYIWTPGYWAYGPYGYYWVPGVWVEPPYADGLWTPGYWGFYSGSYLFYPGHWGMHIGWYGGINYGFGYVGFGYEGGYWNGGHFFYNRVYNNINGRGVRNVYSYRANVRVNNNVRGNNNERVNNNVRGNYGGNGGRTSYRGGPNGVQSQPRASEGNAYREPTAPRMSTQVQHEQNYSTQRGQYASPNSRPATTAETRPLHADAHVTPQVRSGGGGGRSGGHR